MANDDDANDAAQPGNYGQAIKLLDLASQPGIEGVAGLVGAAQAYATLAVADAVDALARQQHIQARRDRKAGT